jgi:phage tail-like protein
MSRNDPLRDFRFHVEIDGEEFHFNEITGGDITVEPIEYREGSEQTFVRKLPGLTKYGNVTFKRGLSASTLLYDWMREIVDGSITRKSVRISVLGEGGDPLVHFRIDEAWPCKYAATDLNAQGNEVAIETLELCHEGLRRDS